MNSMHPIFLRVPVDSHCAEKHERQQVPMFRLGSDCLLDVVLSVLLTHAVDLGSKEDAVKASGTNCA